MMAESYNPRMDPLTGTLVALVSGCFGWVAREVVEWLKAKAAQRRKLKPVSMIAGLPLLKRQYRTCSSQLPLS